MLPNFHLVYFFIWFLSHQDTWHSAGGAQVLCAGLRWSDGSVGGEAGYVIIVHELVGLRRVGVLFGCSSNTILALGGHIYLSSFPGWECSSVARLIPF